MKNIFKKAVKNVNKFAVRIKETVTGNSGEGYIDTATKIIIGVVVGGVILAGLYALFNKTVIPTLTSKISGMFSYAG